MRAVHADEAVQALPAVPSEARPMGAGLVPQGEGRMNLLIIPGGKESAQVRGLQLGHALDARVSVKPSRGLIAWADTVVCVKRSLFEFGNLVRAIGKPLIWDAVDFWDQPEQNSLTESEAKALLQAHIEKYQPVLVVGATQSMADAAGGVYLPHHSRPGLTSAPAREKVQIVAYEGVPKYLGNWMHLIAAACNKRRWTFVINPKDMRDADIVVAFREGKYDGYMCREWKSGVKIVNAMAAGRPIITQDNAAFRELAPIGTTVTDEQSLYAALDKYADHGLRQSAITQSRAEALTLDRVAARYRRILMDVGVKAA